MSFHISLTSILLLANAMLLGIASLVIIRFRREAQALLKFWHSPLGSALAVSREDSSATSNSSDASDSSERRLYAQSVMRLEHQLLQLRRDVLRNAAKQDGVADVPERSPAPSGGLPIENAVRMARMGASADDLARNCGLSPGEARLMQKLHGKTPTKH